MTQHDPPTPIQLDGPSLAMLLEEVSAMAASGRSLSAGLLDLQDASLGKIGRAARHVRAAIDNGQPPADAIASLSDRFAAPVATAMRLMATTGSVAPIDQTIDRIRDDERRRHQVKIAAIHPAINLIVAAVVAWIVLPAILVAVSDSTLIRGPSQPSTSQLVRTFSINAGLVAICIVASLVVVASLASWWWRRGGRFGGQRVDRSRDQSEFCGWLALLVQSPMHVADAIATAAGAVHDPFLRSWKTPIENIRGGCQSETTIAMPDATPEPVRRCVIDFASGRRPGVSIAKDLTTLSQLYERHSSQRNVWWIERLPAAISASIVIAVIVLILRAMIVPLISATAEMVP